MEATAQKKVFGMPYNVGIGFLCALGILVSYEFYSNVLAGPSVPTATATPAVTGAAPSPSLARAGALPGAETVPRRTIVSHGRSEEFNPPIHPKRPEDRLNPDTIDPTIHLEWLAKVQAVEPSSAGRNLFQMGAPPPAETGKLPQTAETRITMVGPVKPPEPPKPPPPFSEPVIPVQLKFYGFSTIRQNGKRTAYFMDGDDIMLAAEGDVLKRRYKVVKIAVTSVLMEDTETKHTQTLPLTEETPGE